MMPCFVQSGSSCSLGIDLYQYILFPGDITPASNEKTTGLRSGALPAAYRPLITRVSVRSFEKSSGILDEQFMSPNTWKELPMTSRVFDRWIPNVLLMCLILSLLYSGPAAHAQLPEGDTASPEVPQELTKEQIDDMVARLSDQEVRELLLEQLNKTAVPEDKPLEKKAIIDRFVFSLKKAEYSAGSIAKGFSEIPTVLAGIWSQVTEGTDASTLGVALKILLFFARRRNRGATVSPIQDQCRRSRCTREKTLLHGPGSSWLCFAPW